MKKISALTCGLMSLIATSVMAAPDVTINFNGSILASTCSASIAAGTVASVSLGQFGVNQFSGSVGDETIAVPFSIDLNGCPASGITGVTATFVGNADANGDLNVTGGATGVSIRIKDVAHNANVVLGTATGSSTLLGLSTLSLPFTANYITTSAVPVAGPANGTVGVNLTYM